MADFLQKNRLDISGGGLLHPVPIDQDHILTVEFLGHKGGAGTLQALRRHQFNTKIQAISRLQSLDQSITTL